MLFLNAKTLIALGFSCLVSAESESFGLVIIRSGAPLQNSGVGVTNDDLTAGGVQAEFVVTDDGQLQLSSGEYAVVGTDYSVSLGTTGSTCWSIVDGYLQFASSSSFSFDANGNLFATSGSDYTYALVPFASEQTGGSPYAADFASGSCVDSELVQVDTSSSNTTANISVAAAANTATTITAEFSSTEEYSIEETGASATEVIVASSESGVSTVATITNTTTKSNTSSSSSANNAVMKSGMAGAAIVAAVGALLL